MIHAPLPIILFFLFKNNKVQHACQLNCMKSSTIYYDIMILGGSKMNDYIINFLKAIMAIDSPSGYTKEVIHYCQKEAEALGFHTQQTNKGNLEIYVDGQNDYTIGFCGHVDTLG